MAGLQKNVCGSHCTIRLWNPSIMLQILCEFKKWLCKLVKEKFMKQGEAQIFMSGSRSLSCELVGIGRVYFWNYHSRLFIIFFPLHPLLVFVGGGVLSRLAGFIKRFLHEVLQIL